jgi:hypothetical protein
VFSKQPSKRIDKSKRDVFAPLPVRVPAVVADSVLAESMNQAASQCGRTFAGETGVCPVTAESSAAKR